MLRTLRTVAFAAVLAVSASAAAPPRPYLWNVGGQPPNSTFNVSDVVPEIENAGAVALVTTYFGAMPCIDCKHTGEWCNGGLPQLANLTYHEQQMERHLAARADIPVDYAGYIVLDYESWRGSWNGTKDEYRNGSIALARQQHPELAGDEAALRAAAARDYGAAAVEFLAFTLRAVRRLRPRIAGVGYYGYPDHTYYHPELDATKNDAQMAVFAASTALFPSIYLPYKSGVDKPFADNEKYVLGGLTEAARVNAALVASGALPAPLPVLPYAWYRYHDGEPSALQLLTEQDTQLQFVRPLAAGLAAAIVIWGEESHNATAWAELEGYFRAHAADFRRPRGGASRASPAPAGLGLVGASGAPLPPPPPPLPLRTATSGPIPAWSPCSL